jgi:arsenite oxidase small subunit
VERRDFIKICAVSGTCSTTCAATSSAHADPRTPSVAGNAPPAKKTGVVLKAKNYARVKLVDQDGRAIKAASLKVNHNYVFNYPFESTPCFLLSLDKEARGHSDLVTERGESYVSPSGVGPRKNLVAYSAICAHKLAYPSSQVSFISFRDKPSALSPTGKVIGCCADKSAYDPFAGARVLGGPAPQPLAAILLEHDPKTDALFVTGTVGGEKFDEFFTKYEFKLSLERGGSRAKEPVSVTAVLRDLSAHSTQTAQC